MALREFQRVEEHLTECAACRRERLEFERLISLSREACDPHLSLSEAVRSRIAIEAAERGARRSFAWIIPPKIFLSLHRTYITTSVAALVVTLVALSVLFRNGHAPIPQSENRITAIRVVSEDGLVRLAWTDGERSSYTVYKSPDPRKFSKRQAHVVKGNVWTDAEPNSSPVIFYRIE